MGNCLIILNYNDCLTTVKLLNKIKHYVALDHILVVDNCSNDDSYRVMSKYTNDKIHIICTKRNCGYAAGNNYGARYAIEKWSPDTLFFANPDVQFEENIVERIEEGLYMNPRYAVATALVKRGYNAWDLPGFLGTIRMLFMLVFTSHKYFVKRKLIKNKKIHEVGVVEGSFFAIKTPIFKAVGGFDERTFLYLEENILAYRLRQKGYKEIVLSDICYIHEHSTSIKKAYKSKTNAFKLFYPSFMIYLQFYVRCGKPAQILFGIMYLAAYAERVVYDSIKFLSHIMKQRKGSKQNQ